MGEKTEKKGDLEINEDMAYHRREWKAHKIGWGIFGALLVVSALGLTGDGPLARTRSEGHGGVRLEHQHIGHYEGPAVLRFEIPPRPGDTGTASIEIGRRFVEGVRIDHIDPEPERVEAHGDRYRFEFERQSGDSILVQMHYDPATIGAVPLEVRVDDGQVQRADHFYFP